MDLYSCKLEIAVCSAMENPEEYLECIHGVNCMNNLQLFYQPRYKEMTISVQKSVEGRSVERGEKKELQKIMGNQNGSRR